MYVLEDSPSIISVGRLVLDDGYDFYWRHKDRKAVLVRPDGRRIVLENDNYTPMLTIKETVSNKISEIQADAKAAPVWEDSEPEAESTASADSRKFFIEMFSGTGGLGHGIETYDVYVHYFDIKHKRESVPQKPAWPKMPRAYNKTAERP